MKREITVNNIQEFEKLQEKGNLSVSNFIVTAILLNLDTKKKNVFAMSVVILEDDEIYDITVNRDHFLTTLQEQLKIQEKFEKYEMCHNIIEGINYLKRNLEK